MEIGAVIIRYSSIAGSVTARLLAVGLALVLGACASKPPLDISRPGTQWESRFEHPISFHTLVDEDLLVVGTSRHLFGVDPRSGKRIWRLRNVSATRRDVIGVRDAPFILINDASGGHFDDAGTYVLAVDRGSGRIQWESPVLTGRVLQGRVDRVNQRLYVVTVSRAHGDDRGLLSDLLPGKGLGSGLKREPTLAALDMGSGQTLWARDFGQRVLMRPTVRESLNYGGELQEARPFDLGLYHPPVLSGRHVCVTYEGIYCFSRDSGQPAWGEEFEVIDDKLALSYPNPLVTENLLVAGGSQRVQAFDPQTGERLWRSDKLGRMPEMLNDESRIFVQLGGRYFDLDKEKWRAKGKFGAASLDKYRGETLWRYDGAKDSITNLLIFGGRVWLADEKYLIVLDRYDGDVIARSAHELKDPPAYVVLNERRNITLISESEISAYDPDTTKRLWYARYPPPGIGLWKRFSAGLLHASGSVLKISSTLIAYGSGLVPGVPSLSLPIGSGKKLLRNTVGAFGEDLTETAEAIGEETGYANLEGGSQYFVTKLKGSKEILLVAVSINDGATERMTALPSESPNLVIDESNGLGYQADDKLLMAIPIRNRDLDALGGPTSVGTGARR